MQDLGSPLALRRHRLFGYLAAIQAALELLDRRTPLSAEQRDLIEPALQATHQLTDELRAALAAESAAAAD